MRDFPSLKLLDRFRPAFARAGIDYGTMRLILQAKLTMDRRRAPTALSQTKAKTDDGKDRNLFVGSLWLYALMGLILVPFVLFGDNFLFQSSTVFGIFMFLVATTMISDFSSVLLDVRDRAIIGTKPVDGRTIGAAKAVHACIYISLVTAATAGAPFVAGLARHGVGFALIMAAGLVLADLLIVVATALLYLFILRWFDGEKLKDTINYVQIGLSIAITVGYQLLARSFTFANMDFTFEPAWWHLFVVPLWFGAPFELFLNGNADPFLVALSALGVIVPIAAMALYVRLLPTFERSLVKLTAHGGRPRRARRRMIDALADALCASKEERAFFRFASSMLTAEREFKLKVYPALGFSIVFPFVFLFQALDDMSLAELAGTRWYLTVYIGGTMIPTVLYMLRYSGAYKGAWVYQVAPISDWSPVYRGTTKAAMVRLLAPIVVLLGVVYTVLFGMGFLPHFAAAALGFCLYAVLCFRMLDKGLPFSESFVGMKGGGFLMILAAVMVAAFALLHLAASFVPWGVWAYIALLLPANWYVWRKGFR
ncbi:hypothetical protein MO973_15295 [Paenibacillus sp. TRM 82003]|nr:hypothetical protein [Paenibacillus sp. TRM 82003]